jgi:type IV secretion system protein VirB9
MRKIIFLILLTIIATANAASVDYGYSRKVKVKKLSNAMHRKIVGIAAVKAANWHAVKRPESTSYVNSIMNFAYMPGALYRIYCAPLTVTDLQFQPGERIVSVAAGDTIRWEVSKTFSGLGAARTEHLLIKPVDSDMDNSLVITTSLRTYHLLLRATDHTYMAVVTWHYPNGTGFIKKFSDAASYDSQDSMNNNLKLANLDFNYKMYLVKGKQPAWAPKTIFNDGSKTYIQFPANMQEAPTLFLGTGNDIRTVNYRVKGNYYIVDKVVQYAQLRLGQDYPQIVQIAYNRR